MGKNSRKLGVQTPARGSLGELSNPLLPTPPPGPRLSRWGFLYLETAQGRIQKRGAPAAWALPPSRAERAVSPGCPTLASPHPAFPPAGTPSGPLRPQRAERGSRYSSSYRPLVREQGWRWALAQADERFGSDKVPWSLFPALTTQSLCMGSRGCWLSLPCSFLSEA